MNEDQLDPYPLSLCAEIYKLTLYLAPFGRQCAMQVLIGDCEPLVWGKGGRGVGDGSHGPVVTFYRLPIVTIGLSVRILQQF